MGAQQAGVTKGLVSGLQVQTLPSPSEWEGQRVGWGTDGHACKGWTSVYRGHSHCHWTEIFLGYSLWNDPVCWSNLKQRAPEAKLEEVPLGTEMLPGSGTATMSGPFRMFHQPHGYKDSPGPYEGPSVMPPVIKLTGYLESVFIKYLYVCNSLCNSHTP